MMRLLALLKTKLAGDFPIRVLNLGLRRRFQTTSKNPRSIHVRLLEGEAPDVASCTFVGDFRLIGLPGFPL